MTQGVSIHSPHTGQSRRGATFSEPNIEYIHDLEIFFIQTWVAFKKSNLGAENIGIMDYLDY